MIIKATRTLTKNIVLFTNAEYDGHRAGLGETIAWDLVATIDGARCPNRKALHSEWSTVLNFPDYAVRGKWDSFEECIYELDWPPFSVSGHILLIQQHADRILEEEDAERELYFDIVRRAPEEFTQRRAALDSSIRDGPQDATLTIAFHPTPGREEQLNSMLSQAGLL